MACGQGTGKSAPLRLANRVGFRREALYGHRVLAFRLLSKRRLIRRPDRRPFRAPVSAVARSGSWSGAEHRVNDVPSSLLEAKGGGSQGYIDLPENPDACRISFNSKIACIFYWLVLRPSRKGPIRAKEGRQMRLSDQLIAFMCFPKELNWPIGVGACSIAEARVPRAVSDVS